MKDVILISIILILIGCENQTSNKSIPHYQEKELSFLHLKNGYDKSNNWIKNPENLLMIHETFKKIGYKNLIDEDLWTDEWNPYLDVKKKPKNLIDSLELTFENHEISSKYYKEFWERRKKEGNEKEVYKVINEIKQILIEDERIDYDEQIVNDTLEQLLKFKYPERKLTNKESNKLLNYLIEIGLHKSAYNLISGEHYEFDTVKWKKKKTELIELLHESDLYIIPWYEDNTK